jgi:hypothetical protein
VLIGAPATFLKLTERDPNDGAGALRGETFGIGRMALQGRPHVDHRRRAT